jgi:helicase
MVESMTWLLHASAELSRMFAPAFYPKVLEYEICMKNGTRRELLPLIRLRGIGRVRARRLFNNGMVTPEEIIARGFEEVTKLLGSGVAGQIFDQLQRKKGVVIMGKEDKNSSPGQSTFNRFG